MINGAQTNIQVKLLHIIFKKDYKNEASATAVWIEDAVGDIACKSTTQKPQQPARKPPPVAARTPLLPVARKTTPMPTMEVDPWGIPLPGSPIGGDTRPRDEFVTPRSGKKKD